MKDLFVNNAYNYILKYNDLDEYNKIKTKYGLEVLYHFITKNTVIILLSLILGILKENIIFLIFYSILRSSTHGVHLRSNLGCWIMTISVFVFNGFLIKYSYFNIFSSIIISLLCFISIILFAPSDTENRPLIREKVRNRLKTLSISYFIIYLLIFGLLNIFDTYIIVTFALVTININPITYKLLGQTYKNYESNELLDKY